MLKLSLGRMRTALLGLGKENPSQLNKHLFSQISWPVLKAWNNNYLCNIAPNLSLTYVCGINSNDNYYY